MKGPPSLRDGPLALEGLFSSRTQARRVSKALSGLEPNAVSYGCMFDALVNNGNLDMALNLLAEMKRSERSIRPNTVIYSTLIKGCAQNKQVLQSQHPNGTCLAFPPQAQVLHQLLGQKGCLCAALQLEQALQLFQEMKAQGVEVNTVTYNSLVDACARVGAMDKAATLLTDMLEEGWFQPSCLSLAFSYKSSASTAEATGRAPVLAGIKPDLITFSTVIKGYCVHGQMDKGLCLLKAMKERNINPDGVLYNSLLDGCVKAGVRSVTSSLRRSHVSRHLPRQRVLCLLLRSALLCA